MIERFLAVLADYVLTIILILAVSCIIQVMRGR